MEVVYQAQPAREEDISGLVHEEDREVEKQPSFFQSLMNKMKDENSDNELEDEFKSEEKEEWYFFYFIYKLIFEFKKLLNYKR